MADPRRPPNRLAAAWSPAAQGDPPTDDVVTDALADGELDDLLAEAGRHRHSESSITRTLAGDELKELLEASRHRSSLATIPEVNVELIAQTEEPKPEPELPSPAPAVEVPSPHSAAKILDLIEEEMARSAPSTAIDNRGFAPQPPPPPIPQAPPPQAFTPQAPPPQAPPPQAFTPPMAFKPTPAPPPAPAPASPSPGPWAIGQPDMAIARPDLTSVPDWTGAPLRANRRRRILMIGGGAAILVIGLALALADSEPTPEPASLPSVTEAPAPPPPPPPKPAEPTPSQAEIEAREALTKLRDGIRDCVRRGIGTLPGSSPAIPTALKQSKAPGYTPTPADWKTAVWSCARFRLTQPMRFQVQWQLIKPSAEGIGVVWIDENGDGTADRALGFRATLKGKRDPALGDITPIDAAQPVIGAP